MSDKLMIREPIAIIGIGCRFPSGSNLSEFWQLNRDRIDGIIECPSDRPIKMTGWGGFLEGIDKFDIDFFGVTHDWTLDKVEVKNR